MRPLFTIVSGISFLLCAVLCVFWVRSFWAFDGLLHFKAGGEALAPVTVFAPVVVEGKPAVLKGTTEEKTLGRFAGLVSRRGMLSFVNVRVPDTKFKTWEAFSDPPDEARSTAAKMTVDAAGRSTTIGAGTAHFVNTELLSKQTFDWALPCWRLTVPYAALAILSAVLPYLWVARVRLLAKREREGLCLECGHDVKGKKGKCANCGAEIPAEEA